MRAIGICLALASLLSCSSPPAGPRHRTFPAPEEAVRTLFDTVKKGDVAALADVFGPDGQELIDSSDPATARRHRQIFSVAVREAWRLVDDGPLRKTLVVGYEDWPFPVPLVKEGNLWRFDTAAGKEEIIARRIGRNELAVIAVCRTYVAAQRLYARRGHDGKAPGTYAQTFRSDPGRQNGLFWRARHGERPSPLGDLITTAEGRPVDDTVVRPAPFHGYFFRILTAQGPAAPGGAKEYVIDGEMSGGFALVAWPAQYDVTGVMTFIVNRDAVVYEKDLGAETDASARAMRLYDPDGSWQTVQ